MEINPQPIRGNWRAGWALDPHTVSSKARAEGEFETQRTEIGEALYQLKYRGDRSKIEPIAQAAADFLEAKTELRDIEAILPVPPSDEDRPFQPVYELARAIARRLDLLLAPGYLIKIRQTKTLKDLDDRQSRREELDGAFRVKDARLAGKPVLLFDDLYRSGETLREITHVLSSQGRVSDVFVLTITKTRTKK
jgi:predicted amidophosphoribosyltransferase